VACPFCGGHNSMALPGLCFMRRNKNPDDYFSGGGDPGPGRRKGWAGGPDGNRKVVLAAEASQGYIITLHSLILDHNV
jgi:hypothetical protein